MKLPLSITSLTLDELRARLKLESRQYYDKDYSGMTDEVYDASLRLLADKEKAAGVTDETSPTVTVGTPSDQDERYVTLARPMLSLDNTLNATELHEKVPTLGELPIVVEPKYDGIAVELVYIGGVLHSATTRGDGTSGKDVLANARSIADIPKELSGKRKLALEVRGEIFMPDNAFDECNLGRKVPFSNPRNAASGSMRLTDPAITAKRGLRFVPYDTCLTNGDSLEYTHYRSMSRLELLGFTFPLPPILCVNKEEVYEAIAELESKRATNGFDTDGAVVKLDVIATRVKLGSTSSAPRWAFSHKFPAQEKHTALEDVIFGVGRTGAITPVAIVSPTPIGGVTVSRATIHNVDVLTALDLHIGDTVNIRRAGDVIPQLTHAIPELRPKDAVRVVMPTECPVCSTTLVKEEDKAVTSCPASLTCPAQFIGRLKYVGSRRVLNINGLADKTAELLVKSGAVTSVSDLLALTPERIIDSTNSTAYTASTFVDAIKESSSTAYRNFIKTLCIPEVGDGTALRLEANYAEMGELIDLSREQLMSIPDIGEVVAGNILNFFAQQDNCDEYKAIRDKLTIEFPKSIDPASLVLHNQMFVITGSFDGISREEMKEKIRELGGFVPSNVTSKITALIAGDRAGSKLKQAQKLGLPIIDGKDWKHGISDLLVALIKP